MKKELINELVLIEMDEASHDDYVEEYNSKLDFYLSNAERDSYIDYIMSHNKISYDEAVEIQQEVIAEIKRRYEAIQLVASVAGKKGGSVKSERKAEAARENGKKGGRPTTRKYNYTRTGERYPDSLLESNAKLKQMDRRTSGYKAAKTEYQKAFNDYFADVLTRYPGATQIGYDYYIDGNGHELVIIK